MITATDRPTGFAVRGLAGVRADDVREVGGKAAAAHRALGADSVVVRSSAPGPSGRS